MKFSISKAKKRLADRIINRYLVSRYGTCKVVEQLRDKSVVYEDNIEKKTKVISPLKLAYDDSIISQFDSTHAYYIGLLAGEELLRVERQKEKCKFKVIIGGKA
jgi:hypothetical protein